MLEHPFDGWTHKIGNIIATTVSCSGVGGGSGACAAQNDKWCNQVNWIVCKLIVVRGLCSLLNESTPISNAQ